MSLAKLEWFADRGREHQQTGEGGYSRADGASSAEAAGLAALRIIGDDRERRRNFRGESLAIRFRALRGGSLQISLVASRWSRGEAGETSRSWSPNGPADKFTGNYHVRSVSNIEYIRTNAYPSTLCLVNLHRSSMMRRYCLRSKKRTRLLIEAFRFSVKYFVALFTVWSNLPNYYRLWNKRYIPRVAACIANSCCRTIDLQEGVGTRNYIWYAYFIVTLVTNSWSAKIIKTVVYLL